MTERILEEEYVFTDVITTDTTKEAALEKIAEILSGKMHLSEKELAAGLFKREEEGTTGFTDGLAIPHAKLQELSEPKVGVVTFRNPIEWEALDGQGVRAAFVLLTPNNSEDNSHLKLLSQLSRNLMKADFVEKIQNNLSNREGLFEIVGEVINK